MAKPGDCPQCLSLCVGAHALPCGHPVCRKCLRDHYGFQLNCNICNQSLTLPRSKGPEDFTSLVHQLEVDLVTTQLVDQRLKGQGRQSCVMCETRYSTTMCHDCKEQYCDGCAKGHRRQGLAKDHVLQTLPQEEEFLFGAAAPCQVSRRHLVTTLQSSTSHTQPAVSAPSAPASSTFSHGPSSQGPSSKGPSSKGPSSRRPSSQGPFLTQPAVLFTIVVFVVFYASVAVHTCVFSPSSSSSPPSPSQQQPADVPPTSTPEVAGQGAARSPPQVPTTTTTTTPPPTVDPMKASPRHVFTMIPTCDDDGEEKPGITSIVSIDDGQRLVMSDVKNRKVKVVDMHHPLKVSASLTLNEQPVSLAVLPDNVIAVTTFNEVIYLLKVTDTVTVMSRITDIKCFGVAGHSDGNLVAICPDDENKDVARIDILSRSGRVVRTVADSKSFTQLGLLVHLYSMDNHVYVSDFDSHAVLKVDLNTGQLLDTMTHTDLKKPHQVTADTSGHLYIASWDSLAVFVRSPSGEWRKLVEASQHSEQGYDNPFAVCVTSSGRLIVAWFNKTNRSSVVIAYDL